MMSSEEAGMSSSWVGVAAVVLSSEGVTEMRDSTISSARKNTIIGSAGAVPITESV